MFCLSVHQLRTLAALLFAALVLASCGFEIPDVVSTAEANEPEEDTSPTTWSGPGFISVNDVAATPFGLVAVGTDIWLSPNGRTWERLQMENMQANWGWSVMNSVIWDGDRLIAVGQRRANNRVWGSAAVWISVDGRQWRAVPDDSAFTAAGAVSMSDIAVGESGRLVSVGTVAEYGDAKTPVVRGVGWTSSNGTDWTRTDLPNNIGTEANPIYVDAVVNGPAGFAAVGTHIWATSNGLDWVTAANAENGFLGANDIVATPEVQSVLGQPAYRSSNGLDWWTVEDSSAPAGLRAAASGPNGSVAFVSDSLGNYSPYTSPAGFEWAAGDASAFEPTDEVTAVTAFGSGWIAVGNSPTGGRVWRSIANRWQLVSTDDAPLADLTESRPTTDDRSDTGLVVPDAAPATTISPETVPDEPVEDDTADSGASDAEAGVEGELPSNDPLAE